MLKIYGFSTQNNGCGKYRIWQPLEALARLGLAEVRREPDETAPISADRIDDIYRWADVVVAQPTTEPLAGALIAAGRDIHGKKLVVDLDDDIWSVHPMNVGTVDGKLAYIRNVFMGDFDDFWELVPVTPALLDDVKELHPGNIGTFVEKDGEQFYLKQKRPDATLSTSFLLNTADAVTTTNTHLAQVIASKAQRAMPLILPNCLRLPEFARRRQAPRNELWVGWSGSVSHYPDLRPVVEALDDFMRRYPNLRVQIMGSSFDYLFPIQSTRSRAPVEGYAGDNDTLYVADFRDCGERWPGRMRFDTPVTIQKYADWMSDNWQSDIGIAPLEDSNFNAAKSELKWLEYSALGSMTIASKVGPYKRAIKHDKDGKLCGSNGAWKAALEEVIESPERRAELAAGAAQRLHDEYDIDKQAHKWLAVYEGL